MDGSGLLKYQSPATVQAIEEQKEKELEAERNPVLEEMISSLSRHVDKQWQNAREAKKPIEEAMMRATRQRKGEYEPTKLAQIKEANQPEIFMNITDTKCRNAIAWVKDILLQQGERIFAVYPTELPDLPPEIVNKIQQSVVQDYIQNAVMEVQQTGQMVDVNSMRNLMVQKSDEIKETVKKEINRIAAKLADELGDKIHDDWQQGGFYKALEGVIDDIINLKAGIMKGIVFRKERVFKNVLSPEGVMTKKVDEKVIPQWERRSPWFIFPSPRATEVDNGYLIDVIPLRPKQLYNLIGVDGYDAKAIRNVLREFREGGLKNDWLGLSEEFKLGTSYTPPDESSGYPDEFIYAIELWDDIPGELLREWGLKEIEDDDEEYSAVVWKIGNHVIRAMLNYDVRGRKPFSKTSFQNVNDSFWGECVPEKIEDCQQVCNACARSILANIGMGALPQVELNIDRIPPGASKTIWPGKIWEATEDQMASGSKAVNFFQPVMVTEKLMNTYGVFSKIADEHSGVPAYAHGDSQVGGAGNTASGLQQLIMMASRGIKSVVRNVDIDIIIPSLERHYDYLLDNQQVFGLVGDYNLVARGTAAVLAKEQLASRKIEFMANTANPIDVGIIGQENRRKMLFEVAKTLGIELDEKELPPPMQQLPQGAPPPENQQTLDAAGNPAQGVDNRQFNQEAPVQMMKYGGKLKKGEVAIVGEEAPEVVSNVNGETVVTPIDPKILGTGTARLTAEEIIKRKKQNQAIMEELFEDNK